MHIILFWAFGRWGKLLCIHCRPAAFAHGATDELTHHLGHHRVHLGLNMAATAVPLASAQPDDGGQTGSEDVILYFGIIDILQVRHKLPCFITQPVPARA